MHRITALVLLTLCVAAVAGAQRAPASLYPGSVVRVSVVHGGHVTGNLFRSDAQGIVVRHDGDTTRVAWHDMQSLQIARARRPATPVRNGAIAGGVVGLLAGLGYFAFCSSQLWDADPCPEAIPIGALAGGALGAGIGALVWSGSSRGGWIDIPLDRTRLGVAATPRGVGIGARIAF